MKIIIQPFTFPGTRHLCGNYLSNIGSVHQVPITVVWTEAVWNTQFDTSTHAQRWELNNLESSALSTSPLYIFDTQKVSIVV